MVCIADLEIQHTNVCCGELVLLNEFGKYIVVE